MKRQYVDGASFKNTTALPKGQLVDLGGETFYRITDHDAMPPFLMSLVSDSNHWMFVSSNGALTAGRRDPDHALFPYQTDDRIHDGEDQVGGKTILRVRRRARVALWEPFSPRYLGLYNTTRTLAKSVYGNKLVFEEVNHDLGLSFSATWMTSDRFGFVRRATVINRGPDPVALDLLDGIQSLLPDGLTRQFQMEFSTLADAYKEAELEPASGLGLFHLSAIPTDRNEPNEALRATTVWSEGLPPERRLLSSVQVDRFRRGLEIEGESFVRGRRGAYLINARVVLPSHGRQEWSTVADVRRDAANVADLIRLLTGGRDLRAELDEDVQLGTRNLLRLVASADGLQSTADDLGSWRHFSNALFNSMRGGVPDHGYAISTADLRSYIDAASRPVAARAAGFLAALPAVISHRRLLELTGDRNDPDLERLINEYLPLTFSRRHGDPSRPWNIFSINVKSADGRPRLDYEGNWRDIFQNWEALALSFPGYLEGMIFKFVDASTADGYNPYRVTREGFEWETDDPSRPWSHIGYWGDHQVIYLLRLLEASARYRPGALAQLLARPVFTYADLPYRIKPYAAMLCDPFSTIDFDSTLDQQIRQRAASVGSDGRLLPGPAATPYHVNLAEKLLILVLARMFNYIPDAGVWMNTQRPEWNDANNALVGYGVSVVTLCQLRRFVAFCRGLLPAAGAAGFHVSSEVAAALRRVAEVLERQAGLLGDPISDHDRKAVLDALGEAGSDYRSRLYSDGFSGERTLIGVAELDAFCDVALRHLDHSIRANRRGDGLYHAYNLMEVSGDGIAIRRLDEMLEGQVAVLSSGALSARECAEVLDALRQSRLYRADQDSYLLYPDRRLPGFLERNNLDTTTVERSKTLARMIADGDDRIVVRDTNGMAHFQPDLHNRNHLADALAPLRLPDAECAEILELYESVFHHREFTGRSGSFYKYEGLGCVYWHMVSKLLLSIQEVLDAAVEAHEDDSVVARIRKRYAEVRGGLGLRKPPEVYGAMPIDPYSHTPSFIGAQQPGMTGQVKEDLIVRLGEMGVRVDGGRLSFRPNVATRAEFLSESRTFRFFDVDGQESSLRLEPGSLAFTTCQVPVVAHQAGPPRIELTPREGCRRVIPGLALDVGTSSSVFERTGAVRRLDVYWGFAEA
ncbi:MAG: hypothetical protein ACLQGJ_05140 [Candidatus Dormibacteria bacterium]